MSPDDQRVYEDFLTRRFVLFGGPDGGERGGLGDAIADAPTLLEAVRAAHAQWGTEIDIDGEKVRLQWAHVWDLLTDEMIRIENGKQGREILIEELEKRTSDASSA